MGRSRADDIGILAAHRRRLVRERYEARLRRVESLEAEVRDEIEPLLGPAGRPVGDAAVAAWRRRRVDDYLGLPPTDRAWRTWRSWHRARRALALVGAAVLWPVAVLPLRMAGFADEAAARWGLLALLALAALALVAPPRREGRFVDLGERPGPAWSGTRGAARARRIAAAATVTLAVLAVVAIALRPASPAGDPAAPAALDEAHRLVVEQTVAAACGRDVVVSVRPLTGRRYAATLRDGTTTTVEVLFAGRRLPGPGAGSGRIVGPAPACAR